LDVACGQGRHTRFFLEQGFEVIAVDRDISLLSAVGLPAQIYENRLTTIEADLESPESLVLFESKYDAIVVTRYLHRPLLPLLNEALLPGGVLIYETFAVGNEVYGRPSNPDFLLKENELLDNFQGPLTVKAFETLKLETPRPAVVQRICAVRTL
jgi:SAM-dependent methyltransferase